MMDERRYRRQAELGRIFTHPARLRILHLLCRGERNVTNLVRATKMHQPTLSQHLAAMRCNGVVATRREGNVVFYRLASRKIAAACRVMREMIEDLEPGVDSGDAERIARVARARRRRSGTASQSSTAARRAGKIAARAERRTARS